MCKSVKVFTFYILHFYIVNHIFEIQNFKKQYVLEIPLIFKYNNFITGKFIFYHDVRWELRNLLLSCSYYQLRVKCHLSCPYIFTCMSMSLLALNFLNLNTSWQLRVKIISLKNTLISISTEYSTIQFIKNHNDNILIVLSVKCEINAQVLHTIRYTLL